MTGYPRPYPRYGSPPEPQPYRWLLYAAVGIVVVLVFAVLLWELVLVPSTPGRFAFPFGGLLLILFVLWVSFMIVRFAWWNSRRSRYGRYGHGPGPNGRGPYGDPALRMARVRYARGEITREQFEQLVRDLGTSGNRPSSPPWPPA